MDIDSKEKIVKGALQLFLAEGVKAVTMDNIAASLSVSKRTIYECIGDKQSLVEACLNHHKILFDQECVKIYQSSTNPFEALLQLFYYHLTQLKNINPRFFTDLESVVPEVMERSKMDNASKVELFRVEIEKSQALGYVRTELQSDVLAALFCGVMASVKNKVFMQRDSFAFSEVVRTCIAVYFRGIATEKGLELLNVLEKNNNNE